MYWLFIVRTYSYAVVERVDDAVVVLEFYRAVE
jgi:hypothetical protein